ncbi:hypothetical protein [Streptomyces sp. NPDC057002]|uniref:hypothetical protein n=1 Tax=Streptomyces sp. NPDC057002 TaxID=3345992 RepID=UPI00363211DB
MKTVDGPAALVGHFYGGAVITRAAQELPIVKALVYSAAYQPDAGENAFQLSGATKLGMDTATVVMHHAEPELRVKPETFRDVLAADLSEERPATQGRAEPAGAQCWAKVQSGRWTFRSVSLPSQALTRSDNGLL